MLESELFLNSHCLKLTSKNDCTEVVSTLVPVIVSAIRVPLGKPIGNVAFVPFKTKAVIEFLVALTLVFKLSCNLVKLGTILERPTQSPSPLTNLLTVELSLHYA